MREMTRKTLGDLAQAETYKIIRNTTFPSGNSTIKTIRTQKAATPYKSFDGCKRIPIEDIKNLINDLVSFVNSDYKDKCNQFWGLHGDFWDANMYSCNGKTLGERHDQIFKYMDKIVETLDEECNTALEKAVYEYNIEQKWHNWRCYKTLKNMCKNTKNGESVVKDHVEPNCQEPNKN